MEFRNLKKQYQVLKADIDLALAEIIRDCNFIGGRQVKELEDSLAEYVGVKHCVSCGNGTDALVLGLMAWGIGKGDAVFVPDFTFFASGECAAAVGATPIFVDVKENTFNIDSDKLEKAIKKVANEGKYRPAAVIAVDLFGQPAEYGAIKKICGKYGLYLLEDGAQGFGGSMEGKRACSFGDISATSFFPAKPLGCYGDGGAVFTDNDRWAGLVRSYAVHGKGAMKYDNVRIGMNSRLDTLQAAVLKAKLTALREHELASVNEAAGMYSKALKNSGLATPDVPEGFVSSWAQYTVRLPETVDREKLQKGLKELDIPTMIYYPKPMHLQTAFAGTDSSEADCPAAEKLCRTVLSLPMHPYITQNDVDFVTKGLEKVMGV